MAARVPVVIGGSNNIRKCSASDKIDAAYIPTGTETATSIGTLVNSLTPKTTPVDTDQFGLMDSSDTILKKFSWLNLKANLKTYFDTLYHIVGGTDVPITDGGTGGSSAAAARTNLGIPRTLFAYTNDVTTPGTSATDFYEDTMAAGTLATDKDWLEFEFRGVFDANTNEKRIRYYIAGTQVFYNRTYGSALTTLANGVPWILRGSFIRQSNTEGKAGFTLFVPGAEVFVDYQDLTGLDFAANAYDLLLTGQSFIAAGGLTANYGSIIYHPFTG